MTNYEKETRQRWGETAAYREQREKTKNYTKEQWSAANDGLMSIFAEFAECKRKGFAVDSPEAQNLVKNLQAHITDHFYTCTNEILAGLGKMYVCDDRFRENIDQYGEGTAEFASAAIEHFCKCFRRTK